MTLPPPLACLRYSHCQQRWAVKAKAPGAQTGLELGIIRSSSICQPTRKTLLYTTPPSAHLTMITLLFYEAVFPTIELSRVIRNRQEGETSDGLQQSFISQGGSLIPRRWGKRGPHTAQAQLYLHDSGRAVWGNTCMFTSPACCASVVHVTSSSVSSCQKRGVA